MTTKHILATTSTALTALGYSTGDQGTTITTPVGRIVWGHPLKPRQKIDQDTKQPKRDAQGAVIMETSFGLAIPIAEFTAQVWPVMHAEAAKGFPNGTPPSFSWKMTNGDTDIDSAGKPYREREGYAGHIVLAISTTLEPPAAFQWNGSQWQQMQPDAIKCGDYVQVEINFRVNVQTGTRKSSLYVNPRQIAFVGYGTEIVSAGFTADPNAAFGAGPAALPPGASATPVAPAAGAAMPGAPMQPAQPAAMPGATALPNAGGMPAAPQPVAPAPQPTIAPSPASPAVPQRPTDPTHIHDNGNGTEQWFVNGAWDGQAHPVVPAAPATLPPPATGFVANAAGGMPMPGQMPPR